MLQKKKYKENGEKEMTGRIARNGMMIALAFIFSYIEAIIPFHIGIPGVKLGIANLVVVTALYLLGEKEAFYISIVRIVLVGFTFSNLFSMLYSIAGGMLSFGAMLLGKRMKKFSVIGVSVLGGFFHNVGQIVVAGFLVGTARIIYYFPILAISGIGTGIIIGYLGKVIIERINRSVE